MAHRWQRPASNPMFQGEQGTPITIHDGTITQNNHPQTDSEHRCSDADDGFKHLQAHVATSAFDSAEQVDAPKCHPNTRQAVQNNIMDWILQTVTRIQWMLWLNGAAGAGKSAIARSIVALCLAQNIPIARFFFFRTDSTRNSLKPVVATLVHQLIQQLPDLLAIIVPKIEADPLIFKKSLETQLAYLVFEPLRQLYRDFPLTRIVVLLFDGVDECDGHKNQTDFVRLISKFLSSRDLPIIAFFGSRAENQFKQIFQLPEISPTLHQLALDNEYLPDNDIRLFLNDKFTQIKTTHPFKLQLGADWPDPAHIKEILDKSSGQFVYASVVINFVSSPRKHPAQQLDITRGLRPPGNLTPFAQLDALYHHIFSQVEDIDHTLFILAWAIFGYTGILKAFSSTDISVSLVDLASVLVYEDEEIRFLHASLPDFLLDKTRSQGYYLDKRFWCTRLSVHCFPRISSGTQSGNIFLTLVTCFLPHAEGTAQLREHILALNIDKLSGYIYITVSLMMYVDGIKAMDFGDNGELYQGQLDRVTRYIWEHPSKGVTNEIYNLQVNHDISAILAQIASEKVAERALQRTDEIGPESTALHASRDSPEHEVTTVESVADANAVTHHARARASSAPQVVKSKCK